MHALTLSATPRLLVSPFGAYCDGLGTEKRITHTIISAMKLREPPTTLPVNNTAAVELDFCKTRPPGHPKPGPLVVQSRWHALERAVIVASVGAGLGVGERCLRKNTSGTLFRAHFSFFKILNVRYRSRC